MRDHDSKFGPCFARGAVTSGMKVLKTPYHASRAKAICERFLGSVRRECRDHVLFLHEQHLHRVLRAYVAYFNRARPHQGIQSRFPKEKFPLFRQVSGGMALSRFRFWVGYTTGTEERLECFKRQTILPKEIELRIFSCS